MVHLTSFERCYGKMLPKLGTARRSFDPTAYCKFIDSTTSWQWFVLEGERRDDTYLFFGIIVGKEVKLGEFTLKQLEEMETVSLALFFKPAPLSYVKVPQQIDKTKFQTV